MGNFWNPQQQQEQPLQGMPVQGQPPMSNQQMLARLLMARRGPPSLGLPMQPIQGGMQPQQPQGAPGGPVAPPMAPPSFHMPFTAPPPTSATPSFLSDDEAKAITKALQSQQTPALFGLGGAGAAAGVGGQ